MQLSGTSVLLVYAVGFAIVCVPPGFRRCTFQIMDTMIQCLQPFQQKPPPTHPEGYTIQILRWLDSSPPTAATAVTPRRVHDPNTPLAGLLAADSRHRRHTLKSTRSKYSAGWTARRRQPPPPTHPEGYTIQILRWLDSHHT